MNNELLEKINKLMELGKKAIELSDSCKLNEPMVVLEFRNDGSISGDFYSYCLNLDDWGRHHEFNVRNVPALLKALDRRIELAEQELKLIKQSNAN